MLNRYYANEAGFGRRTTPRAHNCGVRRTKKLLVAHSPPANAHCPQC